MVPEGDRDSFCTCYSTISTNNYCTLKRNSNLTILVSFSFLKLLNIRWSYSEYL